MINQLVSFNKWVQFCIRQYYLTASWDIHKSPVELAIWFAKAEITLRDPAASFPIVSPGKVVTLFDFQINEEVTITLVSPANGDLENSQISYFSPLGSQVLGCTVGDIVNVKIFGREDIFQITDVSISLLN